MANEKNDPKKPAGAAESNDTPCDSCSYIRFSASKNGESKDSSRCWCEGNTTPDEPCGPARETDPGSC